LSDNLGDYFARIWRWDWGKETFTSFSTIVGGIIIVVIGFILYKHIVMALSAPFMSPVSEKIETHLTGIKKHDHRITSFKEQLWRGIRINTRNLFKELLFSVPLLAIGNGIVFMLFMFIPVIGIIIVLPLSVTAATAKTVELLKAENELIA